MVMVLFKKSGYIVILGLLIVSQASFVSPPDIAGKKDKPQLAELFIIASINIKEDSLSKEDLKNIFLKMKTKLASGVTVDVVTLKKGKVHTTFLKTYVGKTKSQFDRYWKKQVFTGKSKSLKTFSKEVDLIDYVASHKGVIGYVSTKPKVGKVKILTVEED